MREQIQAAIDALTPLIESDVICPDTKVALMRERERLYQQSSMQRYSVHPIDIDFAGWSIVPEGQHNAWGIIRERDNTLHEFTGKFHYLDADSIASGLNA